MRSCAAQLLTLFAVACLIAATPWNLCADTIFLKNGRKIVAAHVVQQDGQVSYETPSGQLSLPASIVSKVVRDALSSDSVAGTAADRAANLPIAPPNMLSQPGNDDAAKRAVRDGVISSDFLSQLESEATANPTPTEVARLVAAETSAAQFEISIGDFEQAVTYYNRARRFAPDHVGLLVETSYLHLRRSEYSAAQDLLEHARRMFQSVAKLRPRQFNGVQIILIDIQSRNLADGHVSGGNVRSGE